MNYIFECEICLENINCIPHKMGKKGFETIKYVCGSCVMRYAPVCALKCGFEYKIRPETQAGKRRGIRILRMTDKKKIKMKL